MAKYSEVFPLIVDKYEQYVPLNDGMDMIEKTNLIIQHLNRVGQLTNDTVNKWNRVMKWVANDGLNANVSEKIDDLIAKGLFDDLLQKMMDDLNADVSAFKTDVNGQISTFESTVNGQVATINSSLLLKANQSALDTTNANVTANTTALADSAQYVNTYYAKNKGLIINDGSASAKANNTTVLNNLISQISTQSGSSSVPNTSVNGGRIILPAGQIYFDGDIIIKTSVSIEGAGVDFTKIFSDGQYGIKTAGHDDETTFNIVYSARLKDFKLYMTSSTNAKKGLGLTHFMQSVVDNVYVNFPNATYTNITKGINLRGCINSDIKNVKVDRASIGILLESTINTACNIITIYKPSVTYGSAGIYILADNSTITVINPEIMTIKSGNTWCVDFNQKVGRAIYVQAAKTITFINPYMELYDQAIGVEDLGTNYAEGIVFYNLLMATTRSVNGTTYGVQGGFVGGQQTKIIGGVSHQVDNTTGIITINDNSKVMIDSFTNLNLSVASNTRNSSCIVVNSSIANIVDSNGVVKRAFHPARMSAKPTTGNWTIGDKVENLTPSAGGYAYWICTQSGYLRSSMTRNQAYGTVGVANQYQPTTPNGFVYELSTGGTTGASEPSWNTTINSLTTDGTCVWKCVSTVAIFKGMGLIEA